MARVVRWIGRIRAKRPRVRIRCAWCGIVMREGRGPVSHGMCPECAATWLTGMKRPH
jgi:hypothetical protein